LRGGKGKRRGREGKGKGGRGREMGEEGKEKGRRKGT